MHANAAQHRGDNAKRTHEESAQRVRLQRVLAAAGMGARRVCEKLIEEGHVHVNGKTVNRLPAFVDPETDRITVDGRPIPKAHRPVYIMLNKPARVLATTSDEGGRTTIMDLIDHPAKARLFPVGRLDFETTGLVLLTNDGELANRLTHPRFGVPKTYQAEVKGTLDEAGLAELQRGLIKQQRKDDKRSQRETGRVRPVPAGSGRIALSIVGREPGRTVVHITLREGRTGNIAKMLAGAGANVRKLERIAIGPVLLTGVAGGQWRELERREFRALRAAAAGKRLPESVPRRPSAPKQWESRRREKPRMTPASDAGTSAGANSGPSMPARTQAEPMSAPRRKPRTIS